MKTKFTTSVFVCTVLLAACCSFNLEAKSKARFGFNFGSSYTASQPVYVAPRVQPVYIYPSYPVAYEVPVYQTYQPVYVYPQQQKSTGFSFSWSNFWR